MVVKKSRKFWWFIDPGSHEILEFTSFVKAEQAALGAMATYRKNVEIVEGKSD